MAQQRTKFIFKLLLVLLLVVLATYAGLFLAYQQLLQESNLYTEHLVNGIRVAVASTKTP